MAWPKPEFQLDDSALESYDCGPASLSVAVDFMSRGRIHPSTENIRKKIAQPWMAFGSDAGSLAPEGVFLKSNPHPRAYGTFARLLGKYVREEGVISLSEAIRRLTSFPAENLGLEGRGLLQEGYFADIAIFDPATISDRATFADPHQYATGVQHVIVNGVPVLLDGEHTGATPGRFVRKPLPAGS